jgi:hypothetical protein
LSIGTGFNYSINFGEHKFDRDVPYHFMSIEPELRISFNQGVYAAFVYGYYDGFIFDFIENITRQRKGQFFNLRAIITF